MKDKDSLFERVMGIGFHGEGLIDRETGKPYTSRETVERARTIPYDGKMLVSGCWIFAITTQGYHVGMPEIYAALERMKKVGLTYIELEGISTDGVNMVHENREELKKRADHLGLHVVNFATILPDFRHPDTKRRKDAVDLFATKGLEVATLFGCRTIQTDTFHPWVRIYGKPPYTDEVEFEGAQRGYKYVIPDDYDERREFDALLDTLAKCTEAAKRAGLSFCIEPRKGEIVETVGYMLRVLDRVPGLGVVLDTAHLNFGEDTVLAAARLRSYCILPSGGQRRHQQRPSRNTRSAARRSRGRFLEPADSPEVGGICGMSRARYGKGGRYRPGRDKLESASGRDARSARNPVPELKWSDIVRSMQRSRKWISPGGTPILVLLACIGSSLVTHGCGYTAGSTLPEKYRTIHIPAVRNSTREYDLQAPLTNALIRKFVVDGRLRVVDAERADLRLETDITSYSLRPLTYGDEDEVAQFRVAIQADARLIDTRTGEDVWEEKGVRGRSSFMVKGLVPSVTPRGNTGFFASTVRSFPTGNEGEAATEALVDVATQILYLTVESW